MPRPAGPSPGFQHHLIVALIGQVLVVTAAMAAGAIHPIPAALLIGEALAVAAHLAHDRGS